MIKCIKCNKIYIGESSDNTYQRIRTHISDININKNTSISNHFNLYDHNYKKHFKFNIILQGNLNTTKRRRIETFLIKNLNTMEPSGLNKKQ
jgi:hypothetical protein